MAQAVFASTDVERSVTLYTLLPDEIQIVKGLTGRKEQTEVESLAHDIFANGQSTPVLVRKDENGKPVLVYGHRRVAAISHINKHLIAKGAELFRVQAKYQRMDETDALIAAIGENRFRKDVSPVDDSWNIEQLMKRCKLSIDRVAQIYFPEATTEAQKADAVRWVRNRASLTELVPEVREAVKNGEIKLTAAVKIAKLPAVEQTKVVKENTKTVKGEKRVVLPQGASAKKAPVKADGKPAPAAKPTGNAKPVLDALAEAMARAIEVWYTDATKPAEDGLLTSLKSYRAVFPLRKTA